MRWQEAGKAEVRAYKLGELGYSQIGQKYRYDGHREPQNAKVSTPHLVPSIYTPMATPEPGMQLNSTRALSIPPRMHQILQIDTRLVT